MKKYTLNEQLQKGRPLTISLAAAIVAYHGRVSFENIEEYDYLLANVNKTIDYPLPCATEITLPRKQPVSYANPTLTNNKTACDDTGIVIKVFTDYDVIVDVFKLFVTNVCGTDIITDFNWKFELVDSKDDADYLFLTEHIRNFFSIPHSQRVNQFPYEGGFVRKDLLALTVRKYCPHAQWWLPCFDLSTEFHLFFHAVHNRHATMQHNLWIIKPAQGSRGVGHYIACSPDGDVEGVLRTSAACIMESPPEGSEYVAQLLVRDPLLVYGRKFDLRLFVVIKSFIPFEGYMHKWYFARLANKKYNNTDLESLQDREVFLTVNCYSEDEEISSKQERMDNDELERCSSCLTSSIHFAHDRH